MYAGAPFPCAAGTNGCGCTKAEVEEEAPRVLGCCTNLFVTDTKGNKWYYEHDDDNVKNINGKQVHFLAALVFLNYTNAQPGSLSDSTAAVCSPRVARGSFNTIMIRVRFGL